MNPHPDLLPKREKGKATGIDFHPTQINMQADPKGLLPDL
jgi:hypothetical protein